MPTPHPIRGRRTNEELFFDHYPQILGWASQLTRLDRADADDLVQDFYIQVTRISLSLADVDEIAPYLFKILRNLHYSRLRQKGRSPIYDLSIVDYDSLERGLAVADRSGLFLVRANLKTLCEFAYQRKNTSRAASIFILRFFLGYYSSEVMKVVQITRMGVDRSLQVARREAQLYLDKPNATRSVAHQDRPSTPFGKAIDDSHALFLELRRAIFNSCGGPHFQPSALERHYGEGTPTRFTVQELAHLVSCKTCLDRVNAILGLPLLDERSPDDTIGRDNPPGPGSSDGPKLSINRRTKRTASPKERKALDRKAREFFEHRPESLEISVNGETRTSQRVTAEVSELHLKLNRTEEPGFIEVFSEQGVRLAYLHVTEPTLYPGLEQREHIVLSDGRSLDLMLSFASDLPTVHVVYRDPVFAQDFVFDDEIELDAISTATEESTKAELTPESERVIRFPLLHRFSSRSRELFKAIHRHMNPLFASATILAVASVICFLFWLRSGPSISASAFLDRAQMRDASVGVNTQPGVIFQKVRIKAPLRTTERTLYRDIQHRRHVRERDLDANDTRLRAKLAIAGVDWNDPLSAATFRDWHNHEALLGDSVKRTGPDRLTLTTSVSDGAVISESLTVRESDFHAVGKTIELRDYGTVEIAELNYDVLPWNDVNPNWFDPLAVVRPRVSNDVHASLLPRVPAHLSDLELDEAELEARVALSHLHADTSERLELTRGAAGVQVSGIVETSARKQEIKKELRLIPHVTPALYTFEEAERRSVTGGEITSVKQSSVVAAPSPLEKYLLDKGESRAEVSQTYQQFFSASVAVNQNSRAISELLQRFASGEQLTDAAQSALEQLIVQDQTNLYAALQQQESLIKQLRTGDIPSSGDAPSIPSIDALRSAAARNVALCNELIASSNAQPRSAEVILAELTKSIVQTREIVSSLREQSQAHRAQIAPPSTLSKQR